MQSTILESEKTWFCSVGMSRTEIKGLLNSAIADCVLPNGMKTRVYCSTMRTREIDPVALAVGMDICLALKPMQLIQIEDKTMVVEINPGHCVVNKPHGPMTWGKAEPKPVSFLFFNSGLLTPKQVISHAMFRENAFNQATILGES